jgi:hypothetical protein
LLQLDICRLAATILTVLQRNSQLAASLLTTCNRLVIIKPEQAMGSHPDISLVVRDLLARFCLCRYSLQS